MTTKPSVLLAITVYNGRSFVPRALESAVRIDQAANDVDVLVLDDHSPEPGWSAELAALCAKLDIGYYCSPRNLGIPRNVSLGLRRGVDAGYDYVIISNSDVVYPANLVDQLVRTAQSDERIGSVTAWSNNVSVYSLPNQDPDRHLADQDVVDWLSASLAGLYGPAAMDVPAGISFSILIPTPVVRDVGIMDPVFGRGYCEETDWSLRSLAAGYRVTLGIGTFVYHRGGGTNIEAGLLAPGQSTVPANEAILDLRYPLFRTQVDAFLHSDLLPRAHTDALDRIVHDAGQQFGYSVEVGWVPRVSPDDELVRCHVTPQLSSPTVSFDFRGFRHEIRVGDTDVATLLRAMFHREPLALNLLDRGEAIARVAASFGRSAVPVRNYPARV